jgi:hypothetical protein
MDEKNPFSPVEKGFFEEIRGVDNVTCSYRPMIMK